MLVIPYILHRNDTEPLTTNKGGLPMTCWQGRGGPLHRNDTEPLTTNKGVSLWNAGNI